VLEFLINRRRVEFGVKSVRDRNVQQDIYRMLAFGRGDLTDRLVFVFLELGIAGAFTPRWHVVPQVPIFECEGKVLLHGFGLTVNAQSLTPARVEPSELMTEAVRMRIIDQHYIVEDRSAANAREILVMTFGMRLAVAFV